MTSTHKHLPAVPVGISTPPVTADGVGVASQRTSARQSALVLVIVKKFTGLQTVVVFQAALCATQAVMRLVALAG